MGELRIFLARVAIASVSVACLAGVGANESVAIALPSERAYEMASPIFKGGYGANQIKAVAPDGESVAFVSLGAFGGTSASQATNVVVARRGADGWSSTSIEPPASIAPFGSLEDFSDDLSNSLASGIAGDNRGSAGYEGTMDEFLLHASGTPDASEYFQRNGPLLETIPPHPFHTVYEGGSDDLSHLVVSTTSGDPLLPEAVGKRAGLYELVGGQSPRMVAVDDAGALIDRFCEPDLGVVIGKGSKFNAVSEDGSAIFFTANVNPSEGETCALDKRQLFVRVGGSHTVEISRPLGSACAEVPCPGATTRGASEFQGASADGSVVYFTTAAALLESDQDSGVDLYMATLGCPEGPAQCRREPATESVSSLIQVSHDPHVGEAANVQGVVATAPDGSRSYFVARGNLTEGPNAEGRSPVAGADNLYAYQRGSAGPRFVAELCSGPQTSGNVSDIHCPASLDDGELNDSRLWTLASREAQTTADGRFLLFSSYGQLEHGDTDSGKDIYRYDASTERLTRVSVGASGFDGNGNGEGFDASTPLVVLTEGLVFKETYMDTRAISADGSRIVFETAEPLSASAVNGLENVYEWHEEAGGGVSLSLISTGSSDEPVHDAVITPSGRDVFFVTSQGLLPQDEDGAADVYDARIGGGFQVGPVAGEECSADGCQGPLAAPAPVLEPASMTQAPGDEYAPPPNPKAKKAATVRRTRAGKPKASARRKRHRKSKQALHSRRMGFSVGRSTKGIRR